MSKPKVRTRFIELLAEKEKREGKRYSITGISEETGITRAALYPWLRGTLKSYNVDTIAALCDFFECEPGDLLDYIPLDESQEFVTAMPA